VAFFPSVFFPPSVVLLDFFNRILGHFVTRGIKKRDKKNRGNFPQPPKKYLLAYVFSRRPLAAPRRFVAV
jgi:hypothetical protein